MKSYHLDTSAVMRLLVQAPADQYRRISVFLEEQISASVPVFISDLALAEAYFALQSFYLLPKPKALESLAAFIKTPGIQVSGHARAILGQANLATAKPGFVDRLIHGVARATGNTLITFEKAAKNLPDTLVL